MTDAIDAMRIPSREGDSGASAVAEVMVVFMAFLLLIKYLETTWFGVVQLHLVGWDFFAHLMMVMFPLVMVKIYNRPLSDLGLDRSQFHDPVVRRISRVAAAELFLVWIIMLLLPNLVRGYGPALLLPPYSFAEYLGLSETATNLIGWFITVVFVTVFCGFGEEVLFRGYMQGRLNRGLGRPFKVMGIRFGWGLVITSVIFGLGHGFAYFNPFDVNYISFRPQWGAALITGVEGFILGLVYERTRGIVAPSIIHAAIGLFFSAIVF